MVSTDNQQYRDTHYQQVPIQSALPQAPWTEMDLHNALAHLTGKLHETDSQDLLA